MNEETHHPAQPGGRVVVCARCDTAADSEYAPPTWVCSVENGRRQYFCDNCARSHIRAIEGRLDSPWW
ncbi:MULTISPECIES: hypothetical protein [Streptomyces]|uniref:hypothetical protein n=1 Tax=unclassified Streptomyces TaxID=2593676 RepID=UPI000B2DFBD8|nr:MULTISPECIES: hypothetical protein [unclassified Streptomyces]MDX2732118.1 hypothetical protein [Streptomyces sp. PA03-2a]MDX3764690.1 hypothetical protein [Streptomyces sp. AK08-01B]MDX3814269.1 hypothetical protein [Streptomyces sp. AK08-01A]